jgi:hypothetical protein
VLVHALKSVHSTLSVVRPRCARSPRHFTRRCLAEPHPVHAHHRALAGRGRLGLTVAWSRLGHSGRGTCCQPRGAAAARARVEWPPLAPLPSPVLTWLPRLDVALPSGHATLSLYHVPPGRRLTEPSSPFRLGFSSLSPWPTGRTIAYGKETNSRQVFTSTPSPLSVLDNQPHSA